MCFVSCSIIDNFAYKVRLFRDREVKFLGGRASDIPIIRPLGRLIIRLSKNFTTCLQPMALDDGEVVYLISSYGSDEIVMVHDDDDLPVMKDPPEIDIEESCDLNNLPLGLLKAAELETSIHLENVRSYHLEYEDSGTNEYFPKNPVSVYRWRKRKEWFAQTRLGRLLLGK